jgi:4-hydroxy-tetrahydrodipicolinate reductase
MKMIINGINGRMGRMILAVASEAADIDVVAGFDKELAPPGNAPVMNGREIPVYAAPSDFDGTADVMIDFSHYTAIPALLEACVSLRIPAVIATTALGEAENSALRKASERIPIFRSANMSLGINLLAKMGQLAMPVVEDNFNVEIIEKHHTKKVDSPSGTALLLAEAINGACETKKEFLYGRHSKSDQCKITDLGIHAVRGGSLPGQHSILLAGPDETIEITHTVYSRAVFAQGALKAARFIAGRDAGLYSMEDLIAEG